MYYTKSDNKTIYISNGNDTDDYSDGWGKISRLMCNIIHENWHGGCVYINKKNSDLCSSISLLLHYTVRLYPCSVILGT